ncbi:MAG TPA: exodeoxyribonuclease VII large subunit [Acidimicrobiales bacterium]|nr:exodeoxyribonuclease VII large subunit [Acidimicrobiales bacterium]
MTLFGAEELPPRRVSLVRLSSELARSVASLGRVSVEGEVVRPRTMPSGRVFFTLRDRAAQLRVTFSGAQARRCRAVNGERVAVTGTVGYAPDRGDLSLHAEEVVPVGEGAIAAMLAEVRARLAADGLLQRPRRPLPALPRLVGVVCGADAAVRADIESVVAARFAGYPLRFAEANVSGPGAAASVVAALGSLLADPQVDVVIVARGGGDAAQLLPFSDEELCRALCASAVPVVTAIGHEADRPLCDEVADLRCATPSLAAAAVVPERAGLQARLDDLLGRAAEVLEHRRAVCLAGLDSLRPIDALDAGLDRASRRLSHMGGRLRLVAPRPEGAARRLAAVDLHAGMAARLAAAGRRLTDGQRTLAALDPDLVLRRGYAVVRDGAARVVQRSDQVAVGDRLALTLAHGGLEVEVLRTIGDGGRDR